jgi:dTDP-4-dehydrorhamnose 3,5-epimerase
MEVTATPLKGVIVLQPRRLSDRRGYFSEGYNKRVLADLGIEAEFVQDNLSRSLQRATLRGLHFQEPPLAQAKLVSVSRGAVLDVVVDLRKKSPTFGRYLSVYISEQQGNQLFIPVGFAHGFLTLEPDTLFFYKVTDYYSAAHDCGIRWNDKILDIDWGVDESEVTLSAKDGGLPEFDPSKDYFK